METYQPCPTCGKAIQSNAPGGLCPECLMKAGLGSGVDIGLETENGAVNRAFIPPEAAALAPLFPQLEIIELVGKGGMGAVYKARQKHLNRLVALKILPPGVGDDPAFAQRFTREAQALAQLNHPGIVTLFEFGTTSQPPASGIVEPLYYFLMEYVDGVNLRQLMHAGRVSAREALAIVPQICDALQYAHDQGIVHRDIKPENILIDRRGRVKVADFGLAKLMETDTGGAWGLSLAEQGNPSQAGGGGRMTDAGKIMGTPQYMSPEQIIAPGDVDHRADIYALGVVFYQMLTGELPGKKIEPPSKKVHIDVRLDEVVLRALEQKPQLRYQQASVFKTQVETIAGDSGMDEKKSPESPKDRAFHFRPLHAWERKWQTLSRPWRQLICWGLAVVAILCLICFLWPHREVVAMETRFVDTWKFGLGAPWWKEITVMGSSPQNWRELNASTWSFACGMIGFVLCLILGLALFAERGTRDYAFNVCHDKRICWGRLFFVLGFFFLLSLNLISLLDAHMFAIIGDAPRLLLMLFGIPGFFLAPVQRFLAKSTSLQKQEEKNSAVSEGGRGTTSAHSCENKWRRWNWRAGLCAAGLWGILIIILFVVSRYNQKTGINGRVIMQAPFAARLTGAEVELIAISCFPKSTNASSGVTHDEADQSANRVWWRADGSLTTQPCAVGGSSINLPKRDVFDLVFVVKGQTNTVPEIVLQGVTNSGCRFAGVTEVSWAPRMEDMRFRQTLSCDPGLAMAAFRVGVAAGRWENALPALPVESHSMAGREGPLIIQVIQGELETSLVCQYQEKQGMQSRILVADGSGEVKPVKWGQFFGIGNSQSCSATYKTAALKEARIYLQRRPYRWVEFHNVSLKPGQKTQVVVCDEVAGMPVPVSRPAASLEPEQKQKPVPVTNTIKSQLAENDLDRTNEIKLAALKKELEIVKRKVEVGLAPVADFERTQYEMDILLAEKQGYATEAAWIKLQLAEYNLDLTRKLVEVGKLTVLELDQAKLACDLAASSQLILASKPQFCFLAWEDEWQAGAAGAVRCIDGTIATNATELGWIKAMRRVPTSLAATQTREGGSRVLTLWFSSPVFNQESFRQVEILNDKGQTIPVGRVDSRCVLSNQSNGGRGWMIESASLSVPAPKNLTVKLYYTAGPMEHAMMVKPDYNAVFAKENGGYTITGMGQDVEGHSFVSVALDRVRMPDRLVGVKAVGKDNKELSRKSWSPPNVLDPTMATEKFVFHAPLSEVSQFVIGTYRIRIMEWSNVVVTVMNAGK